MVNMLRIILLTLVVLTAGLVAAAPVLTLAQVLSGEEILLSDGRTVRLAGIKVAVPTADGATENARSFLEKELVGKELRLEEAALDRYGRTAASVVVLESDGSLLAVEEAMLAQGLAFLYPPTGSEPKLAALQKAERVARQNSVGIWRDSAYADVDATRANKTQGHFAFVSGVVRKAERIKNKVYLNFGADWRTDFTVAIAAHDLKYFEWVGLDPLTLEGKTVRVRGWVHREFGPMMTVTSPAQIEME